MKSCIDCTGTKIDLNNIKIKNCPYCKAKLKLKWYENPNDKDEQGYICSNCGMFLDIELTDGE